MQLFYSLVNALINTVVQQICVVWCCQQTTTRLIYKMWPLSNLPSNNSNSLSTDNY